MLAVRAQTDCEVLIIDADVAGDVASRNSDLAAALNRLAGIRRRRLERVLAGRAGSDDEGISEAGP